MDTWVVGFSGKQEMLSVLSVLTLPSLAEFELDTLAFIWAKITEGHKITNGIFFKAICLMGMNTKDR